MTITLPRRFWTDRVERDLPMPKALAWSKSAVVVDINDPVISDYLDDAEYYCDVVAHSGDRSYLGLQASARATVKSIKAARALAALADQPDQTEGAPV